MDDVARILIVDDDRDGCASLYDVLSDFGYEVDVAYNGAEALQRIDQKCYDIALLDYRMPDIDGVMRGSGRMRDHGFEIGWGVGRHGPGNNVFSYFVDPLGYVLEYTTDMSIVDEIYRVGGPEDWVWPPGRTDQWGIAPPKSEACKAAQLAIGFA